MDTIFTVTMVRAGHVSHTRIISWYPERDQAITAVLENDGDMNEGGHWPYAVVEEISGRITYPCPPEKEYWYRWHHGQGYKRLDKPSQFKNIVNFGIG